MSSMTDICFGRDFANDPAAVEDDQPVSDFVDMGEIVLDVDASPARSS